MQRFDHLITTRPHQVRQILIGDLHLSVNEPALVQAFLALLKDCLVLPALERLFIIGDWFDAWLGDDAYLSLTTKEQTGHWLTPIVTALTQLHETGCEIVVIHGNRDFLLGQSFCDVFGGKLVYEPYTLTVGQRHYRLEHGDALCTDDKKYQFFRSLMRNRLVQRYLLNKPLEKRAAIADNMRLKSQKDNAHKAQHIMDVSDKAVRQVLKQYDGLIHGHTHRPHRHQLANHKIRYVLGDWRLLGQDKHRASVEAVIGAVISPDLKSDEAKFELFEFTTRVL